MYKKIAIGVVGVVLVSALFFGGRYLYQTWKYKKIVSEIRISNPDLSTLKDGVYKGSFDAILVAADVTVTVEGSKIKSIKIEKHRNEKGKSAEAITDRVIAEQSIEVDTISGATNSSKVILKAIENALTQNSKKDNK
ncbi:FMN-binding protein [Acetivibrio straminisolvens]|uniref:FMN-binding protein n=1 Tax=Acetivibrio straminisolvens TaxID=253314 RepID=UPI00224051E2|nr:FMN-binding protein [Acetivibrio straminisolvens]